MNNTEKLSIGNRFKKLGESINAQVWEIFHWQKYDLDVKGWIAIKTIKSGRNINVQYLADTLHISHPAVVQLFNQLSKSGYVRSGKSDRDKRNTFLQLTEDGERIYNQIEPLMAEAENSLEHLFSETGYDIEDVITKLENALSNKKCFNRVVSSVKSNQMNEVKIVPYNKKYKEDFKRLNIEWLQKYFIVEPADEKMLSSPEKEIIRNGGEIFFAMQENEVTGTCAVLKVDEATFELAKMAVTEKAQGKQIGKKLCLTAIGYAISNNGEKIVLDTNNKLEAAINLYRSLGFLAVPHQYNDKYKRNLLRMELNLKSV